MNVNRREISHTLVRPWAQLRYVGFINLCWLAVSVVLLSVAGNYLREAIMNAEILSNAPMETKASVLHLVDRWIWIAILCVLTSAVLGIFHSVWYSHRIFGPLIPLDRFIEELKAGRYHARLKYREKDELREVMHMMNDLATKLEERHGRDQA